MSILKHRTVLTFILAFALYFNLSASFLPVETGFVTHKSCPGTYNSFPVVVTNMLNVDSLKLVFTYDESKVTYYSSFAVNSQLTNGNFRVSGADGIVTITWNGNPATLINDTIVKLTFMIEGTGQSTLSWNESACFYYDNVTLQETTFRNGIISINPPIQVSLNQLGETCFGKCDANYQATVTGGTLPYDLKWNGTDGRFDTIQTDMCDGENNLLITDANGCELDTAFIVPGLPAPAVRMLVEPDTTNMLVYFQHPVVHFSLIETGESHIIETPQWDFGDGDTAISFNPVHEYSIVRELGEQTSFTIKVTVVNSNGCDTIITQKLNVQVAQIKIGNVLTPDGNNMNDVFKIANDKYSPTDEELYPMDKEYEKIELYVFDRWGKRVYANSNYQNDWSPKNLSDGAYFYFIKLIGKYDTDIRKGSLTILNSDAK